MGAPFFADVLAEISCAKKFIFLESFIIKEGRMWDELLEVLARKAAEGVEVRLIVDHLGSHRLFSNAYVKKLRAMGIRILRFNPIFPLLLFFMNNRDHRKIIVTDGRAAFTGGINIADEYMNYKQPFGEWKDAGIRLRGDAVYSFTLMFIEMWDTFCRKDERINDYEAYKIENEAATDGFVLPYGDTPLDHEQLGENIYVDILTQAERYAYFFTPYLIISEKLISALQLAAKRGVDVRILTPGIPDKKLIFRLTRSYYRYMHDAGVKIYEYTPGFLHTKAAVCDDRVAVVGTINLDYRSLYLHFECAVLLYNSSAVKDVYDDALQTIKQSRQVIPTTKKFRLLNDLLDAVLHLFAPIM
jgi:cardiolipin synthase